MDNGDLTNKELEAAIWYVKHKVVLRRIVMAVVFALATATWAYTLLGISRDFLGFGQRRTLEQQLTQMPVGESSKPVDLELGSVEILSAGEFTDLVVRVRNPNAQWSAQFSYTIGLGDQVRDEPAGFLLPGEDRPFVGTFRARSSGQPIFNIGKVSWRRIDAHAIADFEAYKTERLNFTYEAVEFLPLVEGAGTVSRARFTLVNKTAYSYHEPRFIVLLYRGSKLVGAQRTIVDKLLSGEKRKVEVSWFDRIGAVSNIEVVPEIDVLNSAEYLRPQ